MINKEILSRAHSYSYYRELIKHFVAEGKTSGEKQSPGRIKYTKLNLHRMTRLDKTIQMNSDLMELLKKIKNYQIWIVLSEAWCGDCAQNVPVLAEMAKASEGKIELKILFRDENPDVMKAYLTNGSLSVPKLISLDASTFQTLGTWGPRPQPAQEIMLNWKAIHGKELWDEFEKKLHTWYARNKSQEIQMEFSVLLRDWSGANLS